MAKANTAGNSGYEDKNADGKSSAPKQRNIFDEDMVWSGFFTRNK